MPHFYPCIDKEVDFIDVQSGEIIAGKDIEGRICKHVDCPYLAGQVKGCAECLTNMGLEESTPLGYAFFSSTLSRAEMTTLMRYGFAALLEACNCVRIGEHDPPHTAIIRWSEQGALSTITTKLCTRYAQYSPEEVIPCSSSGTTSNGAPGTPGASGISR